MGTSRMPSWPGSTTRPGTVGLIHTTGPKLRRLADKYALLVPVLRTDNIGAPLLPQRPHRHVRLGAQPHHLKPLGESSLLELPVLQGDASSLLAQPIIDSRRSRTGPNSPSSASPAIMAPPAAAACRYAVSGDPLPGPACRATARRNV